MKKIVLFLFALGFLSHNVSAQQGMMLRHYWLNSNYFNPAEISVNETSTVALNYRSQWLGLEDAPVNYGANVIIPNIYKKLSAGISVHSDILGNVQKMNLEGDIAYSLPLKDGSLNFGLKVGLSNMKFLDKGWITPDTPVDQDNSIVPPGENSWAPNFSAGFSYYFNNWNVGISVLNLLESENNFNDIKILQKRKYYITSGGRIKMDSQFDLLPNVIFYSDLESINFSLNMSVQFDNNLITGIGYNYLDSFTILAGYRFFDVLQLYYSFDIGVTDISSYERTYGSHELTLKYEFSLPKKEEKSKKNRNVRFL